MWIRIRYPVGLFVAGTLVVANLSCTKVVRVPEYAYDEIEIGDHRQWRVRTKQGRVYAVARFSVTDSTLVIHEFDPEVGPGKDVKRLPHVLNLEDVASVEKLKYSEPWNTLALVSVFVVLGFVAYFVLSLRALGS